MPLKSLPASYPNDNLAKAPQSTASFFSSFFFSFFFLLWVILAIVVGDLVFPHNRRKRPNEHRSAQRFAVLIGRRGKEKRTDKTITEGRYLTTARCNGASVNGVLSVFVSSVSVASRRRSVVLSLLCSLFSVWSFLRSIAVLSRAWGGIDSYRAGMRLPYEYSTG